MNSKTIINNLFALFFLISCNTSQSKNDSHTIQQHKKEKSPSISAAKKPFVSKGVKYRFLWKTNAWGIPIEYFLSKNIIPQDILTYYKTLPPVVFKRDWGKMQEACQGTFISNTFYKNKIIYKNIKNGYLRAYTAKDLTTEVYTPKDAKMEVTFFTSLRHNLIFIAYTNEGWYSILKYTKDFAYLDEQDVANTWENIISTSPIIPEIMRNSGGMKSNLFFKLPEYGTTILACKDTARILEDPEKFWVDKQQNHPEQILRIDWDMEKGKFYVKE